MYKISQPANGELINHYVKPNKGSQLAILEAYLDPVTLQSELDKTPDKNRNEKYIENTAIRLAKKYLGFTETDSGRCTLNRYSTAKEVMRLCDLIVLKEDSDQIMVFNYTKGVWEDSEMVVHRLLIEMVQSIPKVKSSDIWSRNFESSVLDIVKRKAHVKSIETFNKRYFAFKNVTLDTETLKTESHQPSLKVTYASLVEYDPNATCPRFKQFIIDLFPEESTQMFIQEWFGYAISTTHTANAFLIGIGSGANGKSTLFDVLTKLIGISNVSSAPLSNLNTPFGIEPLLGKKLNIATESGTDVFETSKLKAITAGESISVNRKNKPEITTVVDAKLVFLMNELPLLQDTSYGLARRLYILPFTKVFPVEAQNRDLPKLLEAELSGVLNWALKGLERLSSNDYRFTESPEMCAARNKYIGIGDPLKVFVDKCIYQKSGYRIDSNTVFSHYLDWMEHNDYPLHGTNSPQVFWRKFKDATDMLGITFKKGKSNGRAVIRDIGLK